MSILILITITEICLAEPPLPSSSYGLPPGSSNSRPSAEYGPPSSGLGGFSSGNGAGGGRQPSPTYGLPTGPEQGGYGGGPGQGGSGSNIGSGGGIGSGSGGSGDEGSAEVCIPPAITVINLISVQYFANTHTHI